MGFLSDIVRDSRPRSVGAPEGVGSGPPPSAEPLGVAALRPEPTVSSPAVEGVDRERRTRAGREPRPSARGPEGPTPPPSPEGAEDATATRVVDLGEGVLETADEPALVRGAAAPGEIGHFRSSDDPTLDSGGADSPGAQAPGYRGAPAEAGGGVEESELSAALGEAGEEGRAATDASSVPLREPSVSPPTIGVEPRQRRRRAGMEPRASARGSADPTPPTSPEGAEEGSWVAAGAGDGVEDLGDGFLETAEEPPLDRAIDSPGARAPGYRAAPAEAGGEGRAATASSSPMPEPPVSSPTAGGEARQRRRRAGMEPRASARGTGGPTPPLSPERAADGEVLARDDSSDRASRVQPEGRPREIPRIEAVARPPAPPSEPPVRARDRLEATGSRQRPSSEPEGPRVQIGQVDVVVQAPPEPRPASKPTPQPAGLASRLYLRRL